MFKTICKIFSLFAILLVPCMVQADITWVKRSPWRVTGTTTYIDNRNVQVRAPTATFAIPYSSSTLSNLCVSDEHFGRVMHSTSATTSAQMFLCEGAVNGWVAIGGGAGAGASTLQVKVNEVEISSPTSSIDFSDQFSGTESPSLEANISLATDLTVSTVTASSMTVINQLNIHPDDISTVQNYLEIRGPWATSTGRPAFGIVNSTTAGNSNILQSVYQFEDSGGSITTFYEESVTGDGASDDTLVNWAVRDGGVLKDIMKLQGSDMSVIIADSASLNFSDNTDTILATVSYDATNDEVDISTSVNISGVLDVSTATFYAVGLSTLPLNGEKVNAQIENNGTLINVFHNEDFSGTYKIINFQDYQEFTTTLQDEGSIDMNLASGSPLIEIKDGDGNVIAYYDLARKSYWAGQALGSSHPEEYALQFNSLNVRSSLGLSHVRVAGSTTIASGNNAQVSTIYRIDASGGDSTITMEGVGVSNQIYGRFRRVCKQDSSTNTVTIDFGASRTIDLDYQDECADFIAHINNGGTSGQWDNMGILNSTSTPVASSGSSLVQDDGVAVDNAVSTFNFTTNLISSQSSSGNVAVYLSDDVELSTMTIISSATIRSTLNMSGEIIDNLEYIVGEPEQTFIIALSSASGSAALSRVLIGADTGAITLNDEEANNHFTISGEAITFNNLAGTDPTLTWGTEQNLLQVNNGTFSVVDSFRLDGLDCTGNSNGGALTTDGSGNVVCSDDDSGGGGGGTTVWVQDDGVAVDNAVSTFNFTTNLVSTQITSGKVGVYLDNNITVTTATINGGPLTIQLDANDVGAPASAIDDFLVLRSTEDSGNDAYIPIKFYGNNDSSQSVEHVRIEAIVGGEPAGLEDGDLIISVSDNGTLTHTFGVVRSVGTDPNGARLYGSAALMIGSSQDQYIREDPGTGQLTIMPGDTDPEQLLKIGIGSGGDDYGIEFDGDSSNGIMTYMEDEERFDFDQNVLIEKQLTIELATVTINGTTYYWPSSDGSSGQVLHTDGSGVLTWDDDDSGGGSGGGYDVEPATVTFQLDEGFTASTGTVSTMTVTTLLTLSALDCTSNTNGGALTTDGSGNVVCSDDNSGGGGGSSSFTFVFPLGQMRIGPSNPAVIENSTNSIFGPLLLFDDTTVEYASFTTTINGALGSTWKLDLIYSMRSATSGTVDFEAEIMCVTPGDSADIDSASYAASASATETVPGTAGYSSKLTITLTDDSCANGDLIALSINRDADDGTNDTSAGDAELRSARIYSE